ncbi:hypothetical protein SVIOM74S_05930 [Streptomyces violarus]
MVRTRSSSRVKAGSPEVSVRSTSVLTKNPTRSSRAWSVRPAITVPTGTSVPAPSFVSSAASPACSTMKRLAPDLRASSLSAVCSSESIRRRTRAPLWDATAGRGRSQGSVSSSGSPANAADQWASWWLRRLSDSSGSPRIRRCHRA